METDVLKIRTYSDFKKFFEDFFPGVYALLKRYIREEEAWDLAQEAFLRLYERWNDFENTESAKAFVYTVAKNLFFNYYKREKLRQDVYKHLEQEESDTNNFLESMAAEEVLRMLYAAVDKLNGQTKTIIQLNLEGKSNVEVAEILNISINTVKTLKKHAYCTLRKYIQKEYWWLVVLLLNYPD